MNPFTDLIFRLMKWPLIICLVIVAVGAIPVMLAEKFGIAGAIAFAVGVVILAWFYIRKRLPTRKREF